MNGYSAGALLAHQVAAHEAAQGGSEFIENGHLLIGILSLGKVLQSGAQEDLSPDKRTEILEENTLVEELFHHFPVDTALLRKNLRMGTPGGNKRPTDRLMHRSDSCRKIFARAENLAGLHPKVHSLHLLAALVEDPSPVIRSALDEFHISHAELQRLITEELKQERSRAPPVIPADRPKPGEPSGKTPFLDQFGRDLTRDARDGKLSPVIGRRREILQIVQILSRQAKNNPVIIGEAGVGKTAIVSALAQRIVREKDSQTLTGKRIIEINVAALVAGAKYRGDFEKRLTGILEEARRHPEIILFIDEFHTILGAGSVEGSLDAANILKPALSRGEVRCIGATTIEEYHRYIEKDAALERRFEQVLVEEPSPEEAVEILRGLRAGLEAYHHVRIPDAALEASVRLSIRFDPRHRLPDKAIDLLDKACVFTRIPALSLYPGQQGSEGQSSREPSRENLSPEVSPPVVGHVLSEKTGIPEDLILGHLGLGGQSPLLGLEEYLREHLTGQNEAIERVCERLIMAQSGLGKRQGPLAVFFLTGPTGVGKTELARLVASYLFGSPSAMIRFDMSEFMEKGSYQKFIGSPPGFIRSDEEGILTGRLRTHPYSVILFDEIEKAHPEVFDLFLQVFDEGRITDNHGRTVDARNAIFILTSNIQVDREKARAGDGREVGNFHLPPREAGERFASELTQRFRPEFLNRIDDVISFRHLNRSDAEVILQGILVRISKDLGDLHGIALTFDDDARKFILEQGFSPEYGVRELRRTVERLVEVPLSRLLAEGREKKKGRWKVSLKEKRIVILPELSS